MNQTITALTDTWLKKTSLKAAEDLTEGEKHPVKKGKVYTVTAINYRANGHTNLDLSHGAGDWWAFDEHWDGLTKLGITTEQVKFIFGRYPSYYQMSDLNECLKRFDITGKFPRAHFLSQIAHESGGLKWTLELASGEAYEGRQDLGNVKPGDGKKFKGAGFLQLTGRANYQRFADYINDSRVMSEGATYVSERYPATSAGFWWFSNGMNSWIRGANPSVRQVTKRVNGGYNGLADRQRYFLRAMEVL